MKTQIINAFYLSAQNSLEAVVCFLPPARFTAGGKCLQAKASCVYFMFYNLL